MKKYSTDFPIMSKQSISLLLVLCLALPVSLLAFKPPELILATSTAILTLDAQKTITIQEKGGTAVYVKTTLNELWSLTVQNKKESSVLSPKVYPVSLSADASIRKVGEQLVFTWSSLAATGKTLPLEVTCTISVIEDAFCFGGNIQSKESNWLLRELTFPQLHPIRIGDENVHIYWPSGLGEHYNNPKEFDRKSFDYPSGTGTMQWFSVNTGKSGLYIGSHDSLKGKKRFSLLYDSTGKVFRSSVQFPVYSYNYTIPKVMVAPYKGDWHAASKRYRQWFDHEFQLAPVAPWVQQDAGWILAILKQQNGHVLWNYKEIDKLCDVARKLNFTTLGLFGWAHGGHDYLYPNYVPDDLMGGRQALKDAIERAHKRGIKIILYANGSIMDVSTEFYRYNGNETMAIREDKGPYMESYRKYNSSPPVVFVKGSPSSKLWRKTMLGLAEQAHELGADGIIYDQIGVISSELNFSKLQDHKLPQEAYTKYRYQMMNEIRTRMKALDSNFVIMTEAINDGVLTDIEYYHGWGPGTGITKHGFPALFRYTFPELVETQRNSSPMINRTEANHAAVYGLRHEIETRYDADKAYLLHDVRPHDASYVDEAYYTPDPDVINEVTPKEAADYVYNLIRFEAENSIFFRTGRFIDTEGIQVKGADIVAKGYLHKDKVGVVVWNTSTTGNRSFEVAVPGYKIVEVKEISKASVPADSALRPNTLRLIIFQKMK